MSAAVLMAPHNDKVTVDSPEAAHGFGTELIGSTDELEVPRTCRSGQANESKFDA